MIKFAKAGNRIAATTKKLEKIAIVAEYLKAYTPEEAAISAVFFSGRPFPVWEEATLQVGGRVLWRIVAELSGNNEAELTAAYRKHGDLGDVAEAVLPGSNTTRHVGTGAPARPGGAEPGSAALSVRDVAAKFREIAAARGSVAKAALTLELLSQATPLEAKYIIKIMTGDLRIGLKESLVEEAIAKAYGGTFAEVQRANMLLGDIGETLKLAVARQAWRSAGCGCSIRSASCWPARPSRRKKRSAISRMRWSKTNTMASARRPTFQTARCSSSRARATRSPNRFPNCRTLWRDLPRGRNPRWRDRRVELAKIPPAAEGGCHGRARPGPPLQRTAAAPGTQESQRKADAASSRRVSRLRRSLRRR